MKPSARFFQLPLTVIFLFWVPVYGQAGLLQGKKIGLYLNSSGFSFEEGYNIPVSQFLKVREDRSQSGQLRAEFMIRIGEMFAQRLNAQAEADTVIFLNADPQRIYAFRNAYDTERDSLLRVLSSDLDFILVISEFGLHTRIHRSVYIQSNRMITDRIPVMTSRFQFTLTDARNPELRLPVRSCFDEQQSAKPALTFDFFAADSPLGKFLSLAFSRWWEQMQSGEREGC